MGRHPNVGRGWLLACIITTAWSSLGSMICPAPTAWAEPESSAQEPNDRRAALPADMSGTLNIRLSRKALMPPDELVVRRVPLTGLHTVRPFVGPPIRSAILEDDTRDRVVILTADSQGQVVAYLLKDFPLAPYLPGLRACAQDRRCATDRMPATGGIACIAICLRAALAEPAP